MTGKEKQGQGERITSKEIERREELLALIREHIDVFPGGRHAELEEVFGIEDVGVLLEKSAAELEKIADWVEENFSAVVYETEDELEAVVEA